MTSIATAGYCGNRPEKAIEPCAPLRQHSRRSDDGCSRARELSRMRPSAGSVERERVDGTFGNYSFLSVSAPVRGSLSLVTHVRPHDLQHVLLARRTAGCIVRAAIRDVVRD